MEVGQLPFNVFRTPTGMLKLKSPQGGYITGKQRIAFIKQYNLETTPGKLETARALYDGISKDQNVAQERFNAQADEDNTLVSLLPPAKREEFKLRWKELTSSSVFNGSYLEFEGMRFTKTAEVYDVNRNDAESGKPVFAHILQPGPKERIYLKCRFNLTDVDKDNRLIQNNTPGTAWTSLKSKSKGENFVEPDVIVRNGNVIKIFELKMGLGKQEAATKPRECYQLMRCKRLFENWFATGKFGTTLPNIELYFVGWSAPSNSAVVFGRSPLARGRYAVTTLNSQGMARETSINAELVTAIIREIDRKRIVSFTKLVNQIILPWGEFYANYKAHVRGQRNILAQVARNYGATLEKPPTLLKVAGAVKPSNEAGAKLRARTREAVNNTGNSNSEINNNARMRRAQHSLKRLKPENKTKILLEHYTTAQLQALLSKSLARNKPPPYLTPGLMNKIANNAQNFESAYAKFINDHAPELRNTARAAFNTRLNNLARNNPNFSNYYAGIKTRKRAVNQK